MSYTAPRDALPPAAPRTPHIYIAGLGLQTVTQITREVQDACRGAGGNRRRACMKRPMVYAPS